MMIVIFVIGVVVDALFFGTIERRIRRRYGLVDSRHGVVALICRAISAETIRSGAMIENPETLILERDGAVLWVRHATGPRPATASTW